MDGREIDDEPYRYGYQGQFSEKDTTTGWNEFDLRFYDAKIARWLTTDPYGQYYSPYVAMGNTPHIRVDPSGGFAFNFGRAVLYAGVGATVGGIVDLVNGGDGTRGALIGFAAGFLGGGIDWSSLKMPKISFPVGGGHLGSPNVPRMNLPRQALPALETLVRLSREGHDPTPDDDPTWDTPTNRRTRDLHPRVSMAARQLVNAVEEELGIQLRIVQGLRTIEEQNALYAQGRTTPGERVTNARGGQSYHNYGLAFDVVEMNNGRANWNTTLANWNRIRDIGQRFGLEWGGSWTSFVDRPHFQMTFGHTTRQLMQIHGVRIPVR